MWLWKRLDRPHLSRTKRSTRPSKPGRGDSKHCWFLFLGLLFLSLNIQIVFYLLFFWILLFSRSLPFLFIFLFSFLKSFFNIIPPQMDIRTYTYVYACLHTVDKVICNLEPKKEIKTVIFKGQQTCVVQLQFQLRGRPGLPQDVLLRPQPQTQPQLNKIQWPKIMDHLNFLMLSCATDFPLEERHSDMLGSVNRGEANYEFWALSMRI